MQTKNKSELIAIIRRQEQEINHLRERNAAVISSAAGQLQAQVQSLELELTQEKQKSKDLEMGAVMSQGLVLLAAGGVIAILGEKFENYLGLINQARFSDIFSQQDQTTLSELREKMGEFFPKLTEHIRKIDLIATDAWEQESQKLHLRVNNLPPLKKALFEALKNLAKPSNVGSQLLLFVIDTLKMRERLPHVDWESFSRLAVLIDGASNLWPLAVVDSLAPLLRYVGFDEAAEAAGEILDSLDAGKGVPRKQLLRVQSDLIEMKAIEKRTKLSTLIEYLGQGHELKKSGSSPDEASNSGQLIASATQLKRARRAYLALEKIYERKSELTSDEYLEDLMKFGTDIRTRLNEEFSEVAAKSVEVPVGVGELVSSA